MSLDHLPHLFVEGKTDKYVILQLLKSHDIFAQDGDQKPTNPSDVQVVVKVVKPVEGSSGSKEESLADLSQRVRKPNHSAIGYIFDADDPAFTKWNLQQTWRAIRDRLAKAPTLLTTKDKIPENGFHGRHSKTCTPIGVWLMPDNKRDGTIEDFLRELMADGDRIAPFAEKSTREAKDAHGALFPDKDFKKAVMETWLAWQEEPGTSFGVAFQKNQLLKDKPLAQRFVSWVQTLIADAMFPSPSN